ncbi:flavin reductase [Chachezhania antarctica]|uniref:flavin reductase n=1 Tax=Chachezhania antarctica TaxID=2340860 RepID=UPI001968EC62|nr:flavin reductase [Chachezhania antarctica]|tara:strand:+ start:805 stop:1296 length:492 start_codon:yes stop_codon:yes gene_type:complete
MFEAHTAERFREGMSRLGAAVTVLTRDGPAGQHGMTASAVCSVTDDPPTLLICVNRANRSRAMFAENGVVAVNVLAGRHTELGQVFASRDDGERFAAADWHRLETGAPVLSDASVAFDCRISDASEVGSHTVFYCRVAATELASHVPESLIWFGRRFHPLKAG